MLLSAGVRRVSPFAAVFPSMRIFINSSGLDVPAGSSALDAVRAFDAQQAAEVEAGDRIITDSRGLPIDGATAMSAGSILRLIPKRTRAATDDAE
jgi:hypothetical protein